MYCTCEHSHRQTPLAAPAHVFLTDFTGVFLTRVTAGSARGGTEIRAPLTPVSGMIHCPWQHSAYSQKPLWFMELILPCCWGIWDLWFSWGQLSAWQGHCKVQTAKASVSTFTDAAEWDRWSDSWQLNQRDEYNYSNRSLQALYWNPSYFCSFLL